MVGVNSYIHQFGTVAIFATLFAAILVNGEKGCVFDFEHSSDFDLECNNLKNTWTVSEDPNVSPKKILALQPDQEGCLKTKNTVILNSTSPVSFRFYRESEKNDNEKFLLRLIPKEGNCPDDECVWDVASDPHYKPKEWISAEYKFPLKSMKEYYVQVNVGKSKGKALLDHITFPSASGDKCHSADESLRAASEAGMNNINLPGQLTGTASNDSEPSNCPNLLFVHEIMGFKQMEANPDAKRLYDDLLSNYNRLIRPVVNNTETLTVRLGLKLSQLIEVNLKSQVMTTNVWVEQKWTDYKLRWDPEEYGGVEMLYVPSEHIWLPDIVLYNNADGNYEVTLMTKATLTYNGEVYWKPPAIYKSSCEINVLYFPFDEQSCYMKFGSWTYHGYQVDLKHMDQKPGSNLVPIGIDLKEFYLSVEWDILEVPARKNEEYYPCCAEPYSDITFNLKMRRKTLFYTVNLIIPCVGITFLTVLVFYLPSASGEKVTLTVSILLSLTVFFLLLAEIIPPTSLAVPLLGKYLLFTMMLVTLSIFVTVCVLNIYFRSPSTHKMSPWVKNVFLNFIPRLLMMRRPPYSLRQDGYEDHNDNGYSNNLDYREGFGDSYPPELKGSPEFESVTTVYKNTFGHESEENLGGHFRHQQPSGDSENVLPRNLSPEVLSALQGVCFIAQHIKKADKDNEVIEDWKYVSMVLDRFFLWVFTLACIGGTCAIIFQAPSLYDQRIPIDQEISLIQFGKIFLNIPREQTFSE